MKKCHIPEQERDQKSQILMNPSNEWKCSDLIGTQSLQQELPSKIWQV